MPQPGQNVEIDLNAEDLFGWESRKNWDTVAGLMEVIEADEPLPRPWVHVANSGAYYLPSEPRDPALKVADGGHHRAVAYYLSGIAMPARIYKVGDTPYAGRINIRDIQLIDDGGRDRDRMERVRKEALAKRSEAEYMKRRLEWNGYPGYDL